jgi:hypothetical protein
MYLFLIGGSFCFIVNSMYKLIYVLYKSSSVCILVCLFVFNWLDLFYCGS